MPFAKGKISNPEGRKPGVPNKITREMRELINEFLQKNWSKFNSDFTKLDPETRVKFFLDLLNFVVPKLNKTEAKIDNSDNSDIDMERLTCEERQQLYNLMDKAEGRT